MENLWTKMSLSTGQCDDFQRTGHQDQEGLLLLNLFFFSISWWEDTVLQTHLWVLLNSYSDPLVLSLLLVPKGIILSRGQSFAVAIANFP